MPGELQVLHKILHLQTLGTQTHLDIKAIIMMVSLECIIVRLVIMFPYGVDG